MIEVKRGLISAKVEAEFPGTSLRWSVFAGGERKTPVGLAEELAMAADRIAGVQAVRTATEPTVSLCREWRAQLGMDPAAGTGTSEAVVRRRLLEGGFRPVGMVADALTLTTLETGIPIWGFGLPSGRTVSTVALQANDQTGVLELTFDDEGVSVLFAEPGENFQLRAKSSATCLVAIGSPRVNPALVELALERAVGLCVTD